MKGKDKHIETNFIDGTLAQSNIHTISGPIDQIKGSGKATIILQKGTKLKIDDALYSTKSSRNFVMPQNPGVR